MNRRTFLSFLLTTFCLLLWLPAQGQDTLPPTDLRIMAVRATVQEAMGENQIPGLSLAIVRDGKILYLEGFGVASNETKERVTADTVFRLGSISKTFTAVAAMQLVERGKLDLDAPIQKYVPTFPAKEWPITPRQLLGHLSGIRHYKSNEILSMVHYTDAVAPLDIFKADPLLHEPGTKFFYSTYGYNLLGAVVQGAAGKDFVTCLQESIFQPLGMKHTEVDDIKKSIPNRATGYDKSEDGTVNPAPAFDATNKIPGGGLISTARDMAIYANALLANNRLLKNETRELMWTRQKIKTGEETNYGLGWNIATWKEMRTIFHGGGQPGVTTTLWTVPEKHFAVVILTNRSRVSLTPLATRIAETMLEK
jgi:serine beta-lactamase-like protein LACTB, mitochondrial